MSSQNHTECHPERSMVTRKKRVAMRSRRIPIVFDTILGTKKHSLIAKQTVGTRMIRSMLAVLAICAVAPVSYTQSRPFAGPDVQQIYQRLLPQIEKIPAFDHHAHPGYADDPDVDAMAAPPGSAALRERDTNPELVAAAKALFGYPYNDLSPEHAKWLVQQKAELKK